jgi:hypothetical protein
LNKSIAYYQEFDAKDKKNILTKFLIPSLPKEFTKYSKIKFSKEAINFIASNLKYANSFLEIKSYLRKAMIKITEHVHNKSILIDKKTLEKTHVFDTQADFVANIRDVQEPGIVNVLSIFQDKGFVNQIECIKHKSPKDSTNIERFKIFDINKDDTLTLDSFKKCICYILEKFPMWNLDIILDKFY